MNEFFVKVDDNILSGVQWVVEFLNDWLGISQKWVEKGLIFLFFVCSNALLRFTPCGILLTLIMVVVELFLMVTFYYQPKIVRTGRRVSGGFIRIAQTAVWLFQTLIFALATCHATPKPVLHYTVASFFWGFIVTAYLYVTSLDVDGERGAAIRKSIQELMAMFGSSWAPKPLDGTV